MAKAFKRMRGVKPKKRHTPGKMNKTEQAYAEVLEQRKHLGEILDWEFEPFVLKLCPGVSYTPDFLVQMPDLTAEIHEVKACRKGGAYLMEDDAWVKFKMADSIFSWLFRFVRAGRLAKADGGGWKIEYLNEATPKKEIQ